MNGAYQRRFRVRRPPKRTLGAVVLTLNATGWALWLVTVSVRRTTCVSGPVRSRYDHVCLTYNHIYARLKPSWLLGLSWTDMDSEQ